MELETIRTKQQGDAPEPIGIIDISEMPTERVRSVVSDEEVYLERRGDRTFLIPA